MAILVNEQTRVLIQGMTGKEGTQALIRMRNYGTKVLAGVTPGKGGLEVQGVPVYNTVQEALANHPTVNASYVCVPNLTVLEAVTEVITNQVPLINVLTEHVPIQDTAKMIALAKQSNVRIVGPSSIGIMSPGLGRLGSIGGDDPRGIFQKGVVGILSKSGGLTLELAWILTKAGIGQSTAIGIGGDVLIGSTFTDLLLEFEQDPQTKVVVLYGEIGGTYEEEAAELILSGKFTKKVVAFISGQFAEVLPKGTKLGHAGAIIYGEKGGFRSKVEALKKAGVKIAKTPDQIAELVKAYVG